MWFWCHRGFVVAALSVIGASPAWADFVVDKSPSGENLIVNAEKSDGFNFSGKIGEKNSGPSFTIKSDGKLNFGNNKDDEEKKSNDGVATDIVFKNDSKNTVGLSEFSFRGQLDAKAGGIVELLVTDNNNKTFDFKFTGLGKNEDFDRIEIIANTKGEYIKSIELKSLFKSEKENEFSSRFLQIKGSDCKGGSDGKEHSDDGSDGSSNYGDNSGKSGGSGGGVNPNISAVPEPSTLALLSIAAFSVAISTLRAQRKKVEAT